MKITPLGDAAILIEVEADTAMVRNLTDTLAGEKLPGISDIVPAYTTVAVFYDPGQVAKSGAGTPHERVCNWINEIEKKIVQRTRSAGREQLVPVCYGGEYGPDLDDVAEQAGLPPDEVIRLHSNTVYEVRAIGFSPGFPYLGGLPDALHTPRRATPRAQVDAGSVGIGGAQTGIYSLVTPGGWNLIGRTPLRMFRPEAEDPSWLRVGDSVRIEAITEKHFRNWTE